jgi:hypothetical protein
VLIAHWCIQLSGYFIPNLKVYGANCSRGAMLSDLFFHDIFLLGGYKHGYAILHVML